MVSISPINLGSEANDGTGDSLRDGGTKINTNFENLNNGKSETNHNHDGTYEPASAVLAAIRALTPSADRGIYFTGASTAAVFTLTAFSRTLLDDTSASAWRATLELGGAALLNVGTTAGTVAAGDHNHDAAYAAIGHNHDSDYADIAHTHTISQLTNHVYTTATGEAVIGVATTDTNVPRFSWSFNAGAKQWNARLTSAGSLVFRDVTVGADRLTINSDGRLMPGSAGVGIFGSGGTPWNSAFFSSTVEVKGTGPINAVEATGDNTPAYRLIKSGVTSHTARQWRMQLASNGRFQIRDETGAQTPFEIDLSGNTTFGVGTGSASVEVLADGNDSLSEVIFKRQNSTGNQVWRMGILGTGSTRAWFLRNETDTADILVIGASGNLTPGADNAQTCGSSGSRWSAVWAANGTIQTSDGRAKEEVEDAPLGLEFIQSLRPRKFRWKDGEDDREHFGFVAQEVEQALRGRPFGGLYKRTHAAEHDGLNYSELIAPLVAAVQQLTTRVRELESQLGVEPPPMPIQRNPNHEQIVVDTLARNRGHVGRTADDLGISVGEVNRIVEIRKRQPN